MTKPAALCHSPVAGSFPSGEAAVLGGRSAQLSLILRCGPAVEGQEVASWSPFRLLCLPPQGVPGIFCPPSKLAFHPFALLVPREADVWIAPRASVSSGSLFGVSWRHLQKSRGREGGVGHFPLHCPQLTGDIPGPPATKAAASV